MERVTGIEPALSAWEADVLPLNYTRRRANDTSAVVGAWAILAHPVEGQVDPLVEKRDEPRDR